MWGRDPIPPPYLAHSSHEVALGNELEQRKKAGKTDECLKKLWGSNYVINTFDGLPDALDLKEIIRGYIIYIYIYIHILYKFYEYIEKYAYIYIHIYIYMYTRGFWGGASDARCAMRK